MPSLHVDATQLADCATLQVDVPGIARPRLPQLEASVQANRIKACDAASQSMQLAHKGMQTDAARDRSYSDAVRGLSQQQAWAQGLAAFLISVAGLMEAALEDNLTSRAFTDSAADEEGDPCSIVLAHTLQAFAEHVVSNQPRLCCTMLSWSATGQGIAAAYGRTDVKGWCMQPGLLATWNLGLSSLDPNKPDMQLEVDSCLQCCAFHPAHPALIAGGTFNGQLYVWDLSRQGDAQVGKSAISPISHLEPITQLCWQHSMAEASRSSTPSHAYLLLTLAADGRVLAWRWHAAEAPVFGFELSFRHPETHKAMLWGGTCMAPQGQGMDVDEFVVGTETGAVFRCLMGLNDAGMTAFAQALSAGQTPQLRTCVRGALSGHIGAVHGAACSPFQRGLFLSCGDDGALLLGTALQRRPLLELRPSKAAVLCAAWSPVRPLVFAAGTGDGMLLVFDLMLSSSAPAVAVRADPSGGAVRSLAFSSKDNSLLASSTNATVQVWGLSSSLQQMRINEANRAARLAKMVAGGEDVQALLHQSSG